ncbi:TPA: hypothetical protein ACGO2J_000287 [Streptococcus suis]
MTEKELKKLSRAELLEILIGQIKEKESLQTQLDDALMELRQRQLKIDKAGSIAEAALQVNAVFEAAQNAGAQYLENIERLSKEQQSICNGLMEDCEKKTVRIYAETQQKCRMMETDAQEKCDKMIADAKQQSQEYWNVVSQKLEDLYGAHQGLRELLAPDIHDLHKEISS